MRTTLTLDDDVAMALERMRRKTGARLKELVNDALRRGLDESGKKKPRRPFRTPVLPAGRCLLPSLDNTTEVLRIAEGEDFRSSL